MFTSILKVVLFSFFLWTYLSLSLVEASDLGVQATQCGQGVISDADFLSYPKSGDLVTPGEVCTWTIHLETLNEFRFDFSELNINSSNADCSSAGVKIYSLSNLNPPGQQIVSYTFCSENPPPPEFYLGGNLVAIVFYTNEESSAFSSFNLSWRGTTFDRMQTKHLSSFGTTSSGVIRYPVVGSYEKNLIATWLIKAEVPQNKLDFALNSIVLESCSIPQDICACDALILYEISADGVITEGRRFCGETTEALLQGISSQFILAFYTDFESDVDLLGGFDAIYFASNLSTSTTTTQKTTEISTTTLEPEPSTSTSRPTTTTEEPSTTVSQPNFARECGAIMVGDSGTIEYKLNETYGIHERCVWTIRAPESSQITFRLVAASFSFTDNLHILSLQKSLANETLYENTTLHYAGESVTMDGSVAIVAFVSYYLIIDQGFRLEYQANRLDNGISLESQDFIFNVSGTEYPVRYPSLPAEFYVNDELSTIVIAPPNYKVSNNPVLYLDFYQNGLGYYNCEDFVNVYFFNQYSGFQRNATFCSKDLTHYILENRDFMVVVFQSDSNETNHGFQLEWEWEIS